MRIVINHLTRMQKGFICVAGIDLQTQRHMRPVLGSQLRSELLAAHGGPFALRSIVDLGTTHFVGSVPEIEDRQFERIRQALAASQQHIRLSKMHPSSQLP